jgi:hypothetical protein
MTHKSVFEHIYSYKVNIKLTKLSRPPPKRSTEGGEKTLVAAGTGTVGALMSMLSRSPMRES